MLVLWKSPEEPCPDCKGTLQWIEYGFIIHMGDGPRNPTIHEGGCVVGPQNRYCPTCQKYFEIEPTSKRLKIGDRLKDAGPKGIAHIGDSMTVVQVSVIFDGIIREIKDAVDTTEITVEITGLHKDD